MVGTAAVMALSELAKLGLQAYFAAMRGQGKTPEEIDQYYNDKKAEFQAKSPDTLTPPPQD